MNFEYRLNPDGTFALYNTEIEDIYFSNIGAHKEALKKFVIPSAVNSINKKKIKILDVCYGMGYNSKSFVDYCLKNNLDFEFEIDAIDIDKNILLLGLMIFDKNISDDIHFAFGKNLLDSLNFDKNIDLILKEDWIKFIFDDFRAKFDVFNLKNEVFLYQKDKIKAFLHNIYYQNLVKSEKLSCDFKINFILGDLLDILPQLNNQYDLIFHDAFSIRKQPQLWSEVVMANYYRLLNTGGKFLTYSNSRVLRRTLDEIGFDVKINFNELEKQNGTIGIKI